MVTMEPVQSSNLAAIGYDAEAQALHVQFHGSPRIWRYGSFPASKWEEFKVSSSKGVFFARGIKGVHPVLEDVAGADSNTEVIERPSPSRASRVTQAEQERMAGAMFSMDNHIINDVELKQWEYCKANTPTVAQRYQDLASAAANALEPRK